LTHRLTLFCVMLLSTGALSAQNKADSTRLEMNQHEINLHLSPWLEWGEWLENYADLQFQSTGRLGEPNATVSRSSAISNPFVSWQGLPLLNVWNGGGDVSLIPADAITGCRTQPGEIVIKTRTHLGGKPSTRFHYRTLNDLSDLDITQRMAFSSRLSLTAAGFQQSMKPEDPFGQSINDQQVDRALLGIRYKITPNWQIDYHLLRNRTRIDTVQAWFDPHADLSMTAPMYRRLRYDHRLNIIREDSTWTTTVHLGHTTDRQQWIDTLLDTTATQRSGDTQIKIIHGKADTTGQVALGLWSVFRRLDFAENGSHDHTDSWHRAFFNLSKPWQQWQISSQLAVQHASSWGQWDWLAAAEAQRPVNRHIDVDIRWQRDVRAHALGTRHFINNRLYPGTYFDVNTQKPAMIDRYSAKGFNDCQNGHTLKLGIGVHTSGITVKISPFYTVRHGSLQPVLNTAIPTLSLADRTFGGVNGRFSCQLASRATVDGAFSWVSGSDNALLNPDWSGHIRLFLQQSLFAPDLHITTLLQAKFWTDYDILSVEASGASIYTQSSDFTLDAKISAKVLTQGWLGFSIENILDKKIYTTSAIPRRGRTLRLGFIWELFD